MRDGADRTEERQRRRYGRKSFFERPACERIEGMNGGDRVETVHAEHYSVERRRSISRANVGVLDAAARRSDAMDRRMEKAFDGANAGEGRYRANTY